MNNFEKLTPQPFSLDIALIRSEYRRKVQHELILNIFDYEKSEKLLESKIDRFIRKWSPEIRQNKIIEQINKNQFTLLNSLIRDYESLFSNHPAIYGEAWFWAKYYHIFHRSDSSKELFQNIATSHSVHMTNLKTKVIEPLIERLSIEINYGVIDANFWDNLNGDSDLIKSIKKIFDSDNYQINLKLDQISPEKFAVAESLSESLRAEIHDDDKLNQISSEWLAYMLKVLAIYDTQFPENTAKTPLVRLLGLEEPETLKLIQGVLDEISANTTFTAKIKELPVKLLFLASDAFGPIQYTSKDGNEELSPTDIQLCQATLIELANLIHPEGGQIVTQFLGSQNYQDAQNCTDKDLGLACYFFNINNLVFIAGSLPPNGLEYTGLVHELGHFIAQILNNKLFPCLQSGSFANAFSEVPSILLQMLFMEKLKTIEGGQHLPNAHQLNRDICRSIIVRYIPKCLFEIDFLNKLESLTPENLIEEIQSSYKKYFTAEHPDPNKLLKTTLQRLLQPWNSYNYLTSLVVVIPLVQKIVESDFEPSHELVHQLQRLMESAGKTDRAGILQNINISSALKFISTYMANIIDKSSNGSSFDNTKSP